MLESNEAVIRCFVEDAFTGRNLDLLDAIVAEGFVNHDPPFPGLAPGRDGLKQRSRASGPPFPTSTRHRCISLLTRTRSRLSSLSQVLTKAT
jgi:hypothetical protein